MPTILDEINEHNLQLKNAEQAKEKQKATEKAEQKARKEASIRSEENKAKEDLASTKQDFFQATSQLNTLLSYKKADIFTEHLDLSTVLEDLIAQSTLIVDSLDLNIERPAERIQDLTRIVHWATEAVNGTVNRDEALLKLLDKEMNGETCLDLKGIRVLAHLGLAALGMLATAPLLFLASLFLDLLIESLTLPAALFITPLAMCPFVALVLSVVGMVALTAWQIHKAVVAPPHSVGREMRALTNIFESPELTQSAVKDEPAPIGFFTPELNPDKTLDAELTAPGV